ncbi:MAG: right-handed parallel beta-helix repeat-containing protein, partial [Planctomycetes bacterium]|nr:right-handed parallel beta-helix repeat-containing protein [Planctomycetota bacterium]
IPGFYAKMVVKDNATTSALNMRPGLTFELRADDADLYYTDAANTMYGSTTVSSTTGVRCRLNSQPGIFGSGVTLPDGESITLEWEGIISTWPTYIPPVADAGEDFEVVDSDGGGDEGVTLDGSDSFDPDGSIVSYVWYNGETQVATGETAYLTLDVDLYTFTLVVTDDDGETDSDTVVVSVRGKDGYTYYVDYDGGSDSNNGRSTALPFQHCPGDTNATGTAASTSLTQGDKVIFKGGVVYRGEINCNWSGVSGNPIIYDGNSEASFGTGRAVVDGSEVLTGWTQCTSANDCDGNPNYANIYWTYLPAGVTAFSANLYEDDELIWLAQDPNQPDPFWYDEIDNYVTFDSATDTTIVDASYFTQTESTYWDGSTYVLIWAVPNEVFPCLVTGFDPDEDEIAFESLGQTHYSPGKFAMCNSLKILDTAGEYVVREDQTDGNGGCKVYLWPLTSGVSGKTFTVSVRENIFEVSSRSYITIRGFTIQKAASGFGQVGGAGSAIRNSTSSTTRYDIVVTDNVLTMNKSMEKQPVVNLDEVDGCLIQDNEIRENVRSRGCMLSDCVDSSVNDNVLYKNGGTGIAFFGSSYCEMCGNTVTDHKGVHANGLTVYLDSDNILLAGNVVTGGNIAFTSQESDDLTVAYNVLETAEGVYAVAVWNDCAGVDFYNNVVRHTASPGSGISIGSTNNTDIVLKNNIIDGTNALYAGHTCQYNIYTSLMWCQNPQSLGTGEFEADAEDLWVDPDEGDYHLPSDSDAIDAGVDVGFDADIEGTSVPQGDYPDIGAYEYEQE